MALRAMQRGSSISTPISVANGGTGATTAQGAAANLAVPYALAKWGVPCVLASSGSMANNGAVSAMTALPTTYSGGAWLYLPANAIQAGSAAGFYWFVASSTTAGTVYNSTFDGLSVPAAGTTTAFVSTGPGAFTGVAAGEITAATVTIPADSIGPNGNLQAALGINHNTAAGNKIFRGRFSGGGGTAMLSATLSTTLQGMAALEIRNLGVTNRQRGNGVLPGQSASTTPLFSSEDTTAQTTLVFTMEKATATNHAILDGATVLLVYGS